MATDICYKQADKTDIPDIINLYSQPEMDGQQTIDPERAEVIFERMSAYPFYHFYLAYQHRCEKPVGIFALLIMDNLGHQGTPSGIVEGVCVAQYYQGQGIGKAMMNKAMELCRQAGCYKMVLSSNVRREWSHQFYRDLGFEQHGISFKVEAF